MISHEMRMVRGVIKGLRHSYPISYGIHKRIDKLTDPFELKVRELFEIHAMFANQGWLCLPEHDNKYTHYRGRGHKQNEKLYTEKQRLRVVAKHFEKTMATIRKLEAERGKNV